MSQDIASKSERVRAHTSNPAAASAPKETAPQPSTRIADMVAAIHEKYRALTDAANGTAQSVIARSQPGLEAPTGRHAEGIDWYEHRDIATTMARAQQLAKPIIFKFYVDWCPPCALLEETLLQDSAVRAAASEYFCVRVNGDLPGADPLLSNYHVVGYPTFVIARPDGTRIGRFQDAIDAGDFANQLRTLAAATSPEPSWQEDFELPSFTLPTDALFEDIAAMEESGRRDEAKTMARQIGAALVAQFDTDLALRTRRSGISTALELLVMGEAYAEAIDLAERAARVFPDHFMWPFQVASIHQKMNQWEDALNPAQRAFDIAAGRTRLRAGYLYYEILLHELRPYEARLALEIALESVNWETNTFEVIDRWRTALEKRLANISP